MSCDGNATEKGNSKLGGVRLDSREKLLLVINSAEIIILKLDLIMYYVNSYQKCETKWY
jgi:hypothetical protein